MTVVRVTTPICLTREGAAEYVQLVLEDFDAFVREGRLPGPIPGTQRWYRKALDRSLAQGYWSREGEWCAAQAADIARFPAQKVYFIASERAVKIGISASPIDRMKALQTAHHDELEILGWMPGHEATERLIHEKFAKEHIRGEWFRKSRRLLRFIEEVSR